MAKGVVYQGGFVSLVGGSFFMGILWRWVAYKTKSIKIVTVAHIITNFFAFTGLIFENRFLLNRSGNNVAQWSSLPLL